MIFLQKTQLGAQQKEKGRIYFMDMLEEKMKILFFFYVMDYSRTPDLKGKDADARLSIGFLNGKPILKGESGGLSVDAENDGLTEDYLRNYFGTDYDKIMNILQDKANEVGSNHPAKIMLKKAALNPRLLKKLLKNLLPDEKFDFYKQVLKQEDISPAVLLFLSKSDVVYVRRQVVFNPNTTPETLLTLSSDENYGVRIAVASNLNTPPEALLILANDGNKDIRQDVADSPNTPLEALLILANDGNEDIRTRVARNPNTPPEVLHVLANDEEDVRKFVARNPNTPLETLHVLADDKKYSIKSAAQDYIRKRKIPNYKPIAETKKHKFSKKRLRQIIMEELLKTLNK